MTYNKKNFNRNNVTHQVASIIVNLREQDYSWADIARHLNERGITAGLRSDNSKGWFAMSVRRLHEAIITNKIRIDNMIIPETGSPLSVETKPPIINVRRSDLDADNS